MDSKVLRIFKYLGWADMILTESSLSWPPPDPDRMRRSNNRTNFSEPFTHEESVSPNHAIYAFRQRQLEDMKRFDQGAPTTTRQRQFPGRFGSTDQGLSKFAPKSRESNDYSSSGEVGWRDSEGDRLDDFGVDEAIEFYDDDDDIPLAELLKKRRGTTKSRGER